MVKITANGLDMAGRPANGTKQFQVQLDPEMVARIDALVGTYKRSEFIREAMALLLAEREPKGD